ncbi:unnamed protein product [Brachionus calyciflorus]|uniref:Uncharacterized protein n=1 Tax=Brachionus calyciflorus TaxID=104777 RepID=A0A813QPS4_9BILA|nr:unnamed protein product [Brachionus calyciflorus]
MRIFNNYINTQPAFYYENLPNATGSSSHYRSLLKNTVQNYFNSFYQFMHPRITEFSKNLKNETNSEDTNSEIKNQHNDHSENTFLPKKHLSLENLFSSAKTKIQSRHIRSKSTDAHIYRDPKFNTMPYTMSSSKSHRAYSSDDESPKTSSNLDVPVKNILLPEIIINDVRYNTPDSILRNYSYLMNSDGR